MTIQQQNKITKENLGNANTRLAQAKTELLKNKDSLARAIATMGKLHQARQEVNKQANLLKEAHELITLNQTQQNIINIDTLMQATSIDSSHNKNNIPFKALNLQIEDAIKQTNQSIEAQEKARV